MMTRRLGDWMTGRLGRQDDEETIGEGGLVAE